MSRAFNADILGRLGEATADELRAALAAIQEDAASYTESTPAAAAEMRSLRDAATAIRGEITNREQAAAEFAADRDAIALAAKDDKPKADDKAKGPAKPAAKDDDEGDDNARREVSQPGAEVQERANEAQAETAVSADEAAQGDGHTAAGRRPLGTAGHQPATNAPRSVGIVKVTTYANGGLARTPNTAQQLSHGDLARSLAERAQAWKHMRPGDKIPLATVVSEYPANRTLSNSYEDNLPKLERVLDDVRSRTAEENLRDLVTVRSGRDGEGALVAAGLCGPLQTLYDIRVIGDQDRPVRDALVKFGVTRGGIQYRPAVDALAQTGGIAVWTQDDDEADPLVPKTCVEIDCPGVVSASVDATYMCLTHSNMSTRFDPEFYDSVLRAQRIAHARFAENRLLTALTTASIDVYSAQVLGATRDILATLDHMVAYVRNRHRLNTRTPLRWIAPAWMQDMIRCDITRQMVGDGLQSLAVTDAEISRWFAARNVNVTYHLDGINPADITTPDPDVVVPAQFYTNLVDDSAVPGFADAISTLLFPEGDWLYLDGGTLDMGVVRDSTLNSQNRFQTFSEEFQTVAFRGIQSIHLVIRAQPNGASAATVSTSAVVD